MKKNNMLETIQWKFGEQEYTNYDTFITDVGEYNRMMFPDFSWDHAATVLKTGTVTIFHESKETNGDRYLDLELISDDDKQFTEGELLYKINNDSLEFFRDKDLRYFEGAFIAEENEDGIVLGLLLAD